MRLYQMELYKICHKKILWVIGAAMLAWMVFYFTADIVGGVQTTIDDRIYYGYEAIQMDREIAKEYEGELTDDTIHEIIEKYGLPTEVKGNVGWKDANYLTKFITDYFSNAYITDWHDYQPPTEITSIKDSSLGGYAKEGRLAFFYSEGWSKFYDFCNMGLEMILVWLIVALAPLFCEEKQQRMYLLIVTSEFGRSKDVRAKIAAAFALASGTYLTFMTFTLALFQYVFGIFQVKMFAGVVLNKGSYWGITNKSMIEFLFISLAIDWMAVMMVTAISIWVSAVQKTVFSSVLTALLIFIMPVVLLLTLDGRLTYLFASSQPSFLVNYQSLIETWGIGIFDIFRIVFAVVVIVCGVVCGSKAWRREEVC